MATIKQAWGKTGDHLGNLGNSIPNAFKSLGDSLSGLATGSSRIGRATSWAVSRPFVWLSHGVNVPVRMVNAAFTKAPVLSAGATVLGGAVLAGSWLRSRGERSTQEAVAEQIEMANQQAAMMAAARQQQSQQNPYCLAPGEFAEAEAKMRGGEPGTPSGGHGARVLNARQAAAEAANQPPTKSMDVAAL